MPKIRITGVQAFGAGVTTEYVESNRDVVRRVLTDLEDKNLLWRSHGFVEDPEPSRISAERIRVLLNAEINNVRHGGKVEASFKKVRSAARVFCGAAGLNSVAYLQDPVFFNRMLTSLRRTVGQECAYLAALCNLNLEQHVIDSLPPQDLSFIPGFSGLELDDGR